MRFTNKEMLIKFKFNLTLDGSYRGSEDLSDKGLAHLSVLHGLTKLQILPLGLCVTKVGMERLLQGGLTGLKSLATGLHQAGQVCV